MTLEPLARTSIFLCITRYTFQGHSYRTHVIARNVLRVGSCRSTMSCMVPTGQTLLSRLSACPEVPPHACIPHHRHACLQTLKAMQRLFNSNRLNGNNSGKSLARAKSSCCHAQQDVPHGAAPKAQRDARAIRSPHRMSPCVWPAPPSAGLLLSASLESTSGMLALIKRCTQHMDTHVHTSVLSARACTHGPGRATKCKVFCTSGA